MTITRERGGQRVVIEPKAGQSPESVRNDVERSFAFIAEMQADGTEKWTGRYRWWGPFKFLAYKEVGPPPWRWPRVGVQPSPARPHPCVRFIAGWRSTAYALVVMWFGRG